jgi:MraZ protein
VGNYGNSQNAGDGQRHMFQGVFSNNMDEKGRVSIPAAFRGVLNKFHADGKIIITRSHNTPCLIAYPTREWKRLQLAIKDMPAKLKPSFKRVVITPSQEFFPDKQGRVLLVGELKEHASLSRTVHFAGTGETFQIWNKESWDKQLEADLLALQGLDLDL